MSNNPKLAIIGLDCASPQLVFDQFKDQMPFITSVCQKGVFGPLASTDPPITVPAWSAMLSSQDPGQLGFYGFRNRGKYDYESLNIATGLAVKAERLWDYFDKAGLRSIVLNVPQTYPPKPLNGLMISGFLSPDTDSFFTYPRGLRNRLDEFSKGEYIIDVRNFRTNEKSRLVHEINLMTKRRFNLANHLAQKEAWDFFMMVEMGPDRLHHGFWRYFDPKHRLYEKGNEFESVIPDYYASLDKKVASLVDRFPDGTLVMIVSDHGIQRMEGGLAINEWLMQQGYLTLKQKPTKPCPLKAHMVDWPKTLAWAEGGYYSRIFFNQQDREPQGVLDPNDREAFTQKLIAQLEEMPGPNGKPLQNKVLIPQDIYQDLKGIAPDLILYPGNLSWRSLATVGSNELFAFENDTGPDDANHAPYGIFCAFIKGQTMPKPDDNRYLTGLSLYDIAPTALTWMNQPVPKQMIGKVLSVADNQVKQ